MSKKCSVRSLSDTSLSELANILVCTINHVQYAYNASMNITEMMVELNAYLSRAGATANIYQDLLRIILSSDYLESNMRFICLQMLLNSSVHLLVTEIFPASYYKKILQLIAAQGSGLRVLNLKGIWVKDEHMEYMYEIVRRCKQLVQLHVPNIANDQLLVEIATNNSQLQILDISGETDITEIGIELLTKGVCAQTLKIVNVGILGEENICYTDIALILEHCHYVESLTSYSYVGAALKFIHDHIDNDFQCRLRYVHDTETEEDTLQVVVETCPLLEHLDLDSPKLGALRALQECNLLKLKLCKFVVTELMSLLEHPIGLKLQHLTMIKGSGNLELDRLTRFCPLLISLDCYLIESLSYSQQQSRFQQMEAIEILSCDITSNSLKSFLCTVSQLKRLAIDSVEFTDDDIVSIFAQHNFKLLEDIWFTLAPGLTIEAVELLIDSCPELQSVGKVTGWALSAEELSLTRELLKSGNSCLVLRSSGFLD